MAGTLEGFFGANAANLIMQLLTSGEYDECLALLQKTLNKILHELQKQNGGSQPNIQINKGINIPTPTSQKAGMALIKFLNDPTR